MMHKNLCALAVFMVIPALAHAPEKEATVVAYVAGRGSGG